MNNHDFKKILSFVIAEQSLCWSAGAENPKYSGAVQASGRSFQDETRLNSLVVYKRLRK